VGVNDEKRRFVGIGGPEGKAESGKAESGKRNVEGRIRKPNGKGACIPNLKFEISKRVFLIRQKGNEEC
jgi:hypothetical protein